ncbi:magnesium ion transporter, partial [Kickxella alabastrina]
MFDLLPDLERLKTKRSKKLEDAVEKGKVKHGFVSEFEHLTRPLKTTTGREKPEALQPGAQERRSPNAKPLKQEIYRFQRSLSPGSGGSGPGSNDGAGEGGGVGEPFGPNSETRARIEQIQQTPDLTLRCTELDIHGNVTVRAGEFQKSELCAQHGLQPRDLRKIDSKFVNQMPAILVRKHAILVNLLHIRALIEADRIVLFDSIGAPASYSQSLLVYELQERLRNSVGQSNEPSQPFEFRALEAVLISVVNSLQSDEEVLVNLVQNVLAYLEESVDRSKLRELL